MTANAARRCSHGPSLRGAVSIARFVRWKVGGAVVGEHDAPRVFTMSDGVWM
jgi:hypothetical protein